MNGKMKHIAAVLLLVALVAVPAWAETIRSKDVEITVRPDGCGLVDEVKYKGEVVISSTAVAGAPTPGYEPAVERTTGAAKLSAKLLTLDANAPCTITEGTSARGHKTVTLENGLLKVTALAWFGGRVIRLESKLTGVNYLDNPYEDRPAEVKGPKDMAGLWGELDDRIFEIKVTTKTDAEAAVTLVGEGEGFRIEKTLRLRRGSAALEVEQKQVSTGDARGADNHLFAKFRTGDTLWGSSRGLAQRFWRTYTSPDCHTDPKIDRWAAVCDTKTGLALVGVHDGPIVRVGTWVRPGFYQLEARTPSHFTLDAGKSMTTTWTLAPCFNMGGVAFANDKVAVGIVPESDVVPAGAKTWRTRVSSVALAAGDVTLTLKATLVDRHGRRVRDLPPVTVTCPLLVAQTAQVDWPVGDLASGMVDMRVDVEAGGRKLGETTLRFWRVDAGAVLEVFRPADAEKNRTTAMSGTVERAQVRVISATMVNPNRIQVIGQHLLGGEVAASFGADVRLNDAGDGFTITHTLTCNRQQEGKRFRAVGLALPLILGNDYNRIRTTVGGEKLNDTWRVDQTDEMINTSTVSDYLSRWPLWKLGGVVQDAPTQYRIWKASDWDTAPMPTLEGNSAPGWVEMNNGKQGIRITVPDMAARAPRGIVVDGYTGAAHVWFYPPEAPPVVLASSGDAKAPSLADRLGWRAGDVWTNTVSVQFQSGPHLRTFRREISDAAFRAALDALGETSVVRTMRELTLPGKTYDEAVASILASDLTFRDFMDRAVGGGYRLRGLCQKLGVQFTADEAKTVDAIVETLKEKYP